MRAGGSPQLWSDLLDATSPDVAFIQETRHPAQWPRDVFAVHDIATASWTTASHGKWGSALWVRDGAVGSIAVPGESWRVAGGAVSMPGAEFLAFSVHLAPLQSSYIRSAHAMLDALALLMRGRDVILGGDWNLSVARREADGLPVTTKQEAALLDRLERDFGLLPAWEVAHPGVALPQTLRWGKQPDVRYHCDGFFLPASWRAHVRAMQVLDEERWHRRSDHNPVVLDIERRQTNAAGRVRIS